MIFPRLFSCVLVALIASLLLGTAELAMAASPAESAEHATTSNAPVDPDLAVFTGIVFLGLLGLLYYFAWGPITEALDAREKTVADHLAAAAATHEEAKALLAAHEARLASAKDEVREMLEEARRDAEATKSQIVAEADAAARAHRDRAVREIDQARDVAVRELAETSANLAIDLAGKVVRQNLSGEQQSDLVREAISKLAGANPSKN